MQMTFSKVGMESAKTLVPDQQRDLLPASRVALEEWQIMMNEVRASRCEEFRLHKLRFDQALAISLLALFAYAAAQAPSLDSCYLSLSIFSEQQKFTEGCI
jgi:hypothetical protein